MTDPVCGMTVDPAHSYGPVTHEGQKYFFCNPNCQRRFEADPTKYLSGQREHCKPALTIAKSSSPSSRRYVCPMDPEVVSDRPGSCPKCGMALEPEVAAPNDAPDPELVDFTRRLKWGAILGVPVVVLAMLDMLPSRPLASVLPMRSNLIVQLLLSLPVV